jgi:hypothetical protein
MLVRTPQLDRSGAGGLPIAPEKRPDPKLPNEFCRPASPSRVREACGPHGGNEHTPTASVSDGVDPALAEVLLQWHSKTEFAKPDNWIFASQFKVGLRCRGSPGECSGGILRPPPNAAASVPSAGTHSATFRSLLGETGAPLKVQQELTRHADTRATMNIYGKAMERSKREAHGNVVRLVLASQVA